MRKIFSFAILITLAVIARAYSGVTVTFNRTGTTASTVTCTVADEIGAALSGASATVTSSHDFKATANAITSSILCPNVNGNASPTITLGVKITGLATDFTYNQAALDIHALNGASSYQQSDDNVVRQWNVAMSSNSTSFGSLTDIDIAAGITAHHQDWTIDGSTATVAADGSLNLSFTITKGTTNTGCFFGLSSVKLTTKAEVTHIFSADKYYNITWNGNSGSYMTEVIGGKLQVAGKSDAAKQAWKLIPTEKNECYYIQNAISDKYIQTCNMTNSNQSLVSLGTSPVEYYITKGSGTTASVYRLTSTDCTGYDDTSASPHGLNKDGASDNIIVWQAGATNTGSYWNLTETTFDREAYDKAQEELKKDPCKSLAVVSLPCTTLSKDTYLSRIDITGEGAQDSLHYISGTPSSAYNLYSKVRATLIRGSEAYLGARLVGKSISGLSVALYADYDGDGNLEDTTRVVSLTDSLTFSLLVPVSTTSTQGRLRIVVDQSGSDDPNEAYGTIYDLPFHIIDKGDVNGDRLVDVGDETVLTEILKGNAVEVPAADVDHNGKVDAKDSKALESLILK